MGLTEPTSIIFISIVLPQLKWLLLGRIMGRVGRFYGVEPLQVRSGRVNLAGKGRIDSYC